MEVNGGRVGGVLVGAFLLWFVPLAWRQIAEYDANPVQPGLKYQLMRRKSDAMHDALDAMVEGRLDRVQAEAAEIEQFASTIEDYLATDVYQEYGKEFSQSVEDLQVAASQQDREAVKEAMVRLERTCIECHFLDNQPGQGGTARQ